MKKSSLIVFCSLLLFFFVQSAFAQEDSASESAKEASISAQVNAYQLPYAGLLPDNPLYFLKIVRDRIVEFLIADPLKKSEFYALEADKHLDAGLSLLKEGKPQLAESSISKGENYFEQSIEQLKEAGRGGQDTKGLALKLSISVRKHEEVLKSLAKNQPRLFDNDSKRVEKFEEEVDALNQQ